MRDFVERHAPPTVTARLILAAVAAAIGFPTGALALGALVNTGLIAAFLIGVPALAFSWLTYVLVSSIARRAREAPEPDWWGGSDDPDLGHEATDELDPVRTLQQRYAEGELTTEEFERRLDRLVESDESPTGRPGEHRERDLEPDRA